MQPAGNNPNDPRREIDTSGHAALAEYPDYRAAQKLVDYLSDAGFPVENVQIVGSGLHTVEQVVGRLTKGKAAGAGAVSGLWFGLFIGLLFGLFTTQNWALVVIGSAAIGAAWGALFGYMAQAATRGQRDFASQQTLAADRYTVQVRMRFIGQAQEALAKFRLAGNQ